MLAPETLEKLSNQERKLYQVGAQVTVLEDEHRKLLALANTTQAVTSGLELDEVLLLDMDILSV